MKALVLVLGVASFVACANDANDSTAKGVPGSPVPGQPVLVPVDQPAPEAGADDEPTTALNISGANSFGCKLGTLSVNFTTSSRDGRPTMMLIDGNKVTDRRGDELRSVRTAIGTLVTIRIASIPDLVSKEATLVVPDVNLQGQGSAAMKLQLILSDLRTSIAGPALVNGALTVNTVKTMSCTASNVAF